MLRKALIIAFLGCVHLVDAQVVEVYNINTLKGIRDVFVIDKGNKSSGISNEKGKVDLSAFSLQDTLIFQHPSFQQVVTTKALIVVQNNVVYMNEKAVDLGEFVVSANKRRMHRKDISNKVALVPKKEIDFQNSQTSADLLSRSGEVFVQKSQQGGGSPMIRGFSANKVLIVVDGVRMNNAIFRGGNLQNVINIDPGNIENAEVIFGPGSVIFGSDALGGVMNFKTKDPTGFEDSLNFNAGAMARYASVNGESTGRLYLDFGAGRWSFLSSASYSSFQDLMSGKNRHSDYPDFGKRLNYVARIDSRDTILSNSSPNLQIGSGFDQYNFMQKIRFQSSDSFYVQYALHYSSTSDIPRYDRLTEPSMADPMLGSASLKYAEWYYGPQTWMMNHLQINAKKPSIGYDRIEINLAWQIFEESRNDRNFGSQWLRSRQEHVDVITANLDFDKRINELNEIFYGFEGNYNLVSSSARQRNIVSGVEREVATRYPSEGANYNQWSAYFSHKLEIAKKATILWGTRYTRNNLFADFSDTTFYTFPFRDVSLNSSAFTASLGYTYRPNPNWQWNLNISSGFRAPNVDDVAKVFDSEPGRVIVPNDNLLPEYAYNGETGVIYRATDKAWIEISTFYTYLLNSIVRTTATFDGQDSIFYDGFLSEVISEENTGQAFIAGASYSLRFNFSRYFGFRSSLTYMQGRDIDNDEPLRHVSPIYGSTGIAFVTEKLKSEIYADYNGWKRFNELAPSERTKTHIYTVDGSPSWWTLNWKFAFYPIPTLAVYAGIENILDMHYRPYSSGISAPGRNVFISLKLDI